MIVRVSVALGVLLGASPSPPHPRRAGRADPALRVRPDHDHAGPEHDLRSSENALKPPVHGWITRFQPTSSRGRQRPARRRHPPAPRRVADRTLPAALRRRRGEDRVELPARLRLPLQPDDSWLINYMIHNLTPTPVEVYITYDVDFVPATSPAAAAMKDVHPIWIDVQNGEPLPGVRRASAAAGTDGQVHLSRRRPERAGANSCDACPTGRRARGDRRAPPPRRACTDLDLTRDGVDDSGSSARRRSTTSPRARCRGTCR